MSNAIKHTHERLKHFNTKLYGLK